MIITTELNFLKVWGRGAILVMRLTNTMTEKECKKENFYSERVEERDRQTETE